MASVPTVYQNPGFDPNSTAAPRAHKTTLGQDDFLKLLVAKMSSQDPLKPQEDTDFIAQMAQFSTLEQSKTMASDIASLSEQQRMLTATGLIGRSVTLNDGVNELGTGLVSSISVQDGAPSVVVNGQNYGLNQVSLISPYTVVA